MHFLANFSRSCIHVVGDVLISTIQPTCFFYLHYFVFLFVSRSTIELEKRGTTRQKELEDPISLLSVPNNLPKKE